MNERHIIRTAQALAFGWSLDNIHAMLRKEGLSEEDVFLCVKAAEVLNAAPIEETTIA